MALLRLDHVPETVKVNLPLYVILPNPGEMGEVPVSQRKVLYLLHGLGDDHTAWSLMTNLSGYAAQHGILIVMPDGGRSFYVNSAADPKAKFEDLIIKDLIPYVDSHFRTIPLPRARQAGCAPRDPLGSRSPGASP